MADAFRGMNQEPGTGLPVLSVPPNTPPLMLNVRLIAPQGREPDMPVGADGTVSPGHGMSVSPSWATMLPFTIPKRLRGAVPGENFLAARGGPHSRIWSHPVTAFADAVADPVPFSPDLALRVDKPGHGLIEPNRPMPADEYQHALAATRPTWTVNEPLPLPRSSPK